MDFKKVIEMIVKEFEAQQIEYAIIGGFALGAMGIARSTMDIDLLVNAKDIAKIDRIFAAHLYRLRFRSENVSQYEGDVNPLGSLDLLHAFRSYTLAMLQRRRYISVFAGQFEIPVIAPEDMIGLKLQAMCNNPARQSLDYADIESLMERFQPDMDWELIKMYFSLFDLQSTFERFQKKIWRN